MYTHITDMIPWTDMIDEGDHHMVGQPQNHWSQLSTYLTLFRANGSLKKENLCGKLDPEGDDGMETDTPMNGTFRHPLVLRIYMGGKPTVKEKTGKNLTRVSPCPFGIVTSTNDLVRWMF